MDRTRKVTPSTTAGARRTEAPHSFESHRHATGGKTRSSHAEMKGSGARMMSRITDLAEVAAAKQWTSNRIHSGFTSTKTKRQLSRPLDLPSLASPGTSTEANTKPRQQRQSQSQTNRRRYQIDASNNMTEDKRSDDSDSIAQRTALQCVTHASMRQAAAKAAMTATALISTTLRDLMGDSNRALAVARQSQIEAENAAARAEGAAKKVKEVSDLAAQDIQRANLELDEANAQAEEAWEFLRRVKSVSRHGRTKENDPLTINRNQVLPGRLGTIAEAKIKGYERLRSTAAHHPLSPWNKYGTQSSPSPSETKKKKIDIRIGDNSVRDIVTNVAFPPQSSASPHYDSMIEPTKQFKGHASPVTQVVSVDQRRFLSSSWDTTVRLWEADTGDCIRTFRGHGDWVTDISVLDSKHFISGSDDRSIKLWSFDKDECIRTFVGHSSFVKSLGSVNGDRFLSGSRDRTVKLFSVSTGHCLQTFKGHTDVVSAIVSLRSDMFASGSHDCSVKIWNVSSETCSKTLGGHTGVIKSLAAVSENELISGSDDKTIRLWNVDSGRCLREFGSNDALVFSVIHLCEGFFLSCGGHSIKVYNIQTGECIKSYDTPRVSLAVARLGEHFVTGADHMLYLWKF